MLERTILTTFLGMVPYSVRDREDSEHLKRVLTKGLLKMEFCPTLAEVLGDALGDLASTTAKVMPTLPTFVGRISKKRLESMRTETLEIKQTLGIDPPGGRRNVLIDGAIFQAVVLARAGELQLIPLVKGVTSQRKTQCAVNSFRQALETLVREAR